MSRTIGAPVRWGTSTLAEGQAVWGAAPGDPDGAYGSTWPLTSVHEGRAALLQAEPASFAEGVSISHETPHLRFVVEALDPTASGVSQWGVDLWGDAQWSALLGEWVDISDRVRGVHWTNGAEQPGEIPYIGNATLTLENLDGEAAPWATDGEFVGSLSRSWLRSGALVRWGLIDIVNHPHWRPFFTGVIEDAQDDTEEHADAWVELTLSELPSRLATSIRPVSTTAGKTLPNAIARVLAAGRWDWQAMVTVPEDDAYTADAVLGNTDEASGEVDDIDASTALRRVGACRYWAFTPQADGTVAFVERDRPPQVFAYVLSNQPDGILAEGWVPLADARVYSSNDRVANSATGNRANGPSQGFSNPASIRTRGNLNNRFGSPFVDLPLRDDSDVFAMLKRLVDHRAADDLGIGSVDIDFDMAPTDLAYVMADIATTRFAGLRVVWEHPSGRVFDLSELAIESQRHGIVPEGGQIKWTATLGLSVTA